MGDLQLEIESLIEHFQDKIIYKTYFKKQVYGPVSQIT